MPPQSFTPKVKDILEENGCHKVRRGKGDHEIWHSPHTNRNFPVDSKILSRHTANGIMKQAGLPKTF
ncbi:MAG: type II toxin-antitoxin system HicA family toxin [Pseudomonadota bacterium]